MHHRLSCCAETKCIRSQIPATNHKAHTKKKKKKRLRQPPATPSNESKIKQEHRSIQLIVKPSIFIKSNPLKGKKKKVYTRRNTKRKMQGVVLNPTYSRPHQTLDSPSCSRPASKVQFLFLFLVFIFY